MGPRNFVLDGGPDPHEKKQFMGFRSGSNPYECKDGCNCKGVCVGDAALCHITLDTCLNYPFIYVVVNSYCFFKLMFILTL